MARFQFLPLFFIGILVLFQSFPALSQSFDLDRDYDEINNADVPRYRDRGRFDRFNPEDHMEAHHQRMKDEMKKRQESRYEELRNRKTQRKKNRDVNFKSDTITDERAVHYMTQSHRKANILKDKLQKSYSAFSSEQHSNFQDLISEYLRLEEIAASYIQQTADEFSKARTMPNKDDRLRYLEKVKAAKASRRETEKAAREAARDKYLQIRAKIFHPNNEEL